MAEPNNVNEQVSRVNGHEVTALLSTAYPALGKALKMGRSEKMNEAEGEMG